MLSQSHRMRRLLLRQVVADATRSMSTGSQALAEGIEEFVPEAQSADRAAIDAWAEKSRALAASAPLPRSSWPHKEAWAVQKTILRLLFDGLYRGVWNAELRERAQTTAWRMQKALQSSGLTPGHQLVGLYGLGIIGDADVDRLIAWVDPAFAERQRYRLSPGPAGADDLRGALPPESPLANPSTPVVIWQIVRSAEEGSWGVAAHLQRACPSVRSATSAMSLRAAHSTYAPDFVAVDGVVTKVCRICWGAMTSGRLVVSTPR
jgi:RimJ/RimL family protein N-acetyltransferase